MSSNPANGEVYSIQHYVIKFVSDLRQGVVFSGYPSFRHQLNWTPRYNWSIVESGVKHHNHNPYISNYVSWHNIMIGFYEIM